MKILSGVYYFSAFYWGKIKIFIYQSTRILVDMMLSYIVNVFNIIIIIYNKYFIHTKADIFNIKLSNCSIQWRELWGYTYSQKRL